MSNVGVLVTFGTDTRGGTHHRWSEWDTVGTLTGKGPVFGVDVLEGQDRRTR